MRSSTSPDWRVVDLATACRRQQQRLLRSRRRVFLGWQALAVLALVMLGGSALAAPICLATVAEAAHGVEAAGSEEGLVRALLALGFIALIIWSLVRGEISESRHH